MRGPIVPLVLAASSSGLLELTSEVAALALLIGVLLFFVRPKGPATFEVRLTGTGQPIKAEVMKAHQSPGRLVRVARDLDSEDGRMLFVENVLQGYNDMSDRTKLRFAYTQLFGAVVDVIAAPGQPIHDVLIGGGATTLARYVDATRVGSTQHVLELDPIIARWSVELLDAPDGLTFRFGDAAETIHQLQDDMFDIAFGDVYDTTQRTPEQVRSTAFLEQIQRVLKPAGTYVVNVIDHKPFSTLLTDLKTIEQSFADVRVLWPRSQGGSISGGSFVVVASARIDEQALVDAVAKQGVLADCYTLDEVRRLLQELGA